MRTYSKCVHGSPRLQSPLATQPLDVGWARSCAFELALNKISQTVFFLLTLKDTFPLLVLLRSRAASHQQRNARSPVPIALG